MDHLCGTVACVAGGITALNAVWGRPVRRIGGGAARRMRTSPIEIPCGLAACENSSRLRRSRVAAPPPKLYPGIIIPPATQARYADVQQTYVPFVRLRDIRKRSVVSFYNACSYFVWVPLVKCKPVPHARCCSTYCHIQNREDPGTRMRFSVVTTDFFFLTGCRDLSYNCAGWVRSGYCRNNAYMSYMKTNCKKSCGLCGKISLQMYQINAFSFL